MVVSHNGCLAQWLSRVMVILPNGCLGWFIIFEHRTSEVNFNFLQIVAIAIWQSICNRLQCKRVLAVAWYCHEVPLTFTVRAKKSICSCLLDHLSTSRHWSALRRRHRQKRGWKSSISLWIFPTMNDRYLTPYSIVWITGINGCFRELSDF